MASDIDHVQAWKAGKDMTDRCMQELNKYTDHEPVHVDICENVMMTVIAGKNHKYEHIIPDFYNCDAYRLYIQG